MPSTRTRTTRSHAPATNPPRSTIQQGPLPAGGRSIGDAQYAAYLKDAAQLEVMNGDVEDQYQTIVGMDAAELNRIRARIRNWGIDNNRKFRSKIRAQDSGTFCMYIWRTA